MIVVLVILVGALNVVNNQNTELAKTVAFKDEQLAHLGERLAKSKTCLNVDTLLEKSKVLIHYDALKEKSIELFDNLGVASKDVYEDLDSFAEKGKRYLDKLFANWH